MIRDIFRTASKRAQSFVTTFVGKHLVFFSRKWKPNVSLQQNILHSSFFICITVTAVWLFTIGIRLLVPSYSFMVFNFIFCIFYFVRFTPPFLFLPKMSFLWNAFLCSEHQILLTLIYTWLINVYNPPFHNTRLLIQISKARENAQRAINGWPSSKRIQIESMIQD